ncbi:hypothetical protein ACHHYP_08814 [Achlya hypogyna]|uniref:Helicase-associated domain-containing protein n=1 Tax=Achlya hypogyna TaxID=1202772 RepID=A0A1V9YP47_ACHHY|nr:hypothetical protein ACHHYP_08814 [Achlya hypogyna]
MLSAKRGARAAFSTYSNINFSLKKQHSIVKVVQLYYEATAMAPAQGNLAIPDAAPWPEEYRGKDVNLSRFRYLYRQNRLDPSVVAQMDAIGFAWSARCHYWVVRARALHTFHAIHGHLNVPEGFIVPANDAAWPLETWGINLAVALARIELTGLPSRAPISCVAELAPVLAEARGQAKSRLRLLTQKERPLTPALLVEACRIYFREHGHLNMPSRYRLPTRTSTIPRELQGLALGRHLLGLRCAVSAPAAVIDPLVTEMGFTYAGQRWELQLRACREFTANFGHLLVPHAFVVPAASPSQRWSADLAGFRLGNFVNALRSSRASLEPCRASELDALGFVWSVLDVIAQQRLEALKVFAAVYGHTRVPQSFVVPAAAPWPVDQHGHCLGTTVKDWRAGKEGLAPALRAALDGLGFVWNMTAWRQARVIAALTTFKELHGHLRVPVGTVVPAAAPWPKETWGMQLKNTLANVRNRDRVEKSWPEQHVASLEALGVFDQMPR